MTYPHSIYEFTHPHLAKYAMALGIIGLGNNRVTDVRDLGVSVRDAATEARWNPPGAAGVRNGERLYLVTGQELRAYDLAGRAPAGSVPGPYDAVAVDEGAHTLYLADAAGQLWRIPTAQFDDSRIGAASQPIIAASFATITGMLGELTRLTVAGGRLVATSSGGTLVSLDLQTGVESGRTLLAQPAAVVGVPARAEVLVDPAQAGDPAALARKLADLLGEDAVAIEAAITSASAPVAVAGYIGDLADDLQSEIDEGRLPGVTVEDGSAVAVATQSGIVVLDAASMNRVASLDTDAPVTGLALVEQGPDQPTIYAASGSRLETVRLASDQRLSLGSAMAMPSTVTQVIWNPATTYVHVLGRSQDGAAPTVYVVEPRSNSVFADARLGFEPAALVIDTQPDRPAEDRADLLAIDGAGTLATVDIGGNGFAYRFPGVLLGAAMAACIYLLARFLFRRRSVAVHAALLVLTDGMFFANARIAMNDAYVAFFIVAALTIFVPLWLGRWRSGRATAGGLLAVGVLLGLALAAKWVGLYAIGAVGPTHPDPLHVGPVDRAGGHGAAHGRARLRRHHAQSDRGQPEPQLHLPGPDGRPDDAAGRGHHAAPGAPDGRGVTPGRDRAAARRWRAGGVWRVPPRWRAAGRGRADHRRTDGPAWPGGDRRRSGHCRQRLVSRSPRAWPAGPDAAC